MEGVPLTVIDYVTAVLLGVALGLIIAYGI